MAGVKQAPKLQLTQVHQLVGFGPRPHKQYIITESHESSKGQKGSERFCVGSNV